MATYTTQQIVRTGLTPTYAAVSSSDSYTPGQFTFIAVVNGGGSPDTVAILVLGGDPPGLTISDLSVSVTNAQTRWIGNLPPQFFADGTTGLGTITHSFTTSVTAGAFQLYQ